jgi:hypothetical protein
MKQASRKARFLYFDPTSTWKLQYGQSFGQKGMWK